MPLVLAKLKCCCEELRKLIYIHSLLSFKRGSRCLIEEPCGQTEICYDACNSNGYNCGMCYFPKHNANIENIIKPTKAFLFYW